MHRVQGGLIACVAVDRCHKAARNADSIVDRKGHRAKAVRGARGVRDDDIVFRQRAVIYPVNYGLIRPF